MNNARGTKAQGTGDKKEYVRRHGAGGGRGRRRRASAARSEKAIETQVRRAGREACKETV